VAHLCTSTKATHLVYDTSLHALATDARNITGSKHLSLVVLPVSSTWDPAGRDIVPMSRALSPTAESAMTCIIYHSSGTTSGLPKPLPQTHRTMTVLHPHIPGSSAVFRCVLLPFSMEKLAQTSVQYHSPLSWWICRRGPQPSFGRNDLLVSCKRSNHARQYSAVAPRMCKLQHCSTRFIAKYYRLLVMCTICFDHAF
jgi:hypothetical protein